MEPYLYFPSVSSTTSFRPPVDDSLHAGLGLAISRKLMALLDSDLRVESQLGKGSCFSFDLKMLK